MIQIQSPHIRNTQTVSTQYSCLTCTLNFMDSISQRDHYRTDWHRYNLKRKVAGMSSITEEDFNERAKIHQQQQQQQQQQSKRSSNEKMNKKSNASNESLSFICSYCGKSFFTEKSLNNHIRSIGHEKMLIDSLNNEKKEKKETPYENENRTQNDDNNEKVEKDDNETGVTMEEFEKEFMNIKIESCLFCSKTFADYKQNVNHMIKKHSFFIPDIEFLIDIEGLLKFLTFKISVSRMCLLCNGKGKSFRSTKAVQKHMLDKGHTMIGFDDGGEEDISPFYDFNMTNDKQKSEINEDDDDYEDISEDDNEENPISVNKDTKWTSFGLQSTSISHIIEDEEDMSSEDNLDQDQADDTVAMISYDESELILPSGKRVGHRDYRRYYRQYLKPKMTSTIDISSEMLTDVPVTHMSSSSALIDRGRERAREAILANNYGLHFPSSAIKSKDQIRDQQKWLMRMNKKMLAVGIRHNNQEHFRHQIL